MTDPKPIRPPLRLVNPHAKSVSLQKVSANIDDAIWQWFFRYKLAGHRGATQNIIAQFFQKLYDECLARKLSREWDIDSEQTIAELLADLNFRKPEPGGAVDNRPAPARRRANPSPAKPKRKSSAGNSDTRSAERAGSEMPNDSSDTE